MDRYLNTGEVDHYFGCWPGGDFMSRAELGTRMLSAALVDVLAEAVAARNGWKRILSRCAPPRRR